jgi:hypothetical protein
LSCPDWKALAAHRQERGGAEPAGWPAALAHFDGCAACRRDALKADPTLVFRRMAAGPAIAVDTDAIRHGVMALRGASRLEAPSKKIAWRRLAAAAVLAVAALSVERDRAPDLTADLSNLTPPTLGRESVPESEWPAFEDLSRPGARVFQANNIVMVYDEGLDV